MKIKRIPIVALLALTLIGCSSNSTLDPSSAQSSALSKGTQELESTDFFPGARHGRGILSVLNLTAEQKTQLRDVIKAKLEEMRPQEPPAQRPTPEERKAKREAMRQAIEQAILEVLTPEQQAKFKEMKAQLDSGRMPEELIDLRIAQLDEKLNLSDAQQQQLRALETWDKLVQLRKDRPQGREGRQQFREQRRNLMQEHQENIKNILTPEQQTLFEQMQADRREKMQNNIRRFGKQRAQRRFAHLSKALDLTESQQAQLKEILQKVREERPEDFRDLSPEERHEFMQSKMAEIDAQIKAILTPEQLAKYEQLKAQRQERRRQRFPDEG